MKLNNKGFAITAVLYGLLILFVVLVSSYLLVLSAKKDRVDTLASEIEVEYRDTMYEGMYEMSLIDQDGTVSYPSPKYIKKNSSVTIDEIPADNITKVTGAIYEIDENQNIIIKNPTSNVKIYYTVN